jgi:hypothetical protein
MLARLGNVIYWLSWIIGGALALFILYAASKTDKKNPYDLDFWGFLIVAVCIVLVGRAFQYVLGGGKSANG